MKHLQIHPSDNLLVALEDLPAGEIIDFAGNSFSLQNDVPQKHKFTTEALPTGALATMYGVTVGKAKKDILKGGLISTENLEHATSGFSQKNKETVWEAPDVSAWEGRTFMGYHRADGSIGTRNYWLVIPLVFCENRNVEVIREALEDKLGYRRKGSEQIDIQSLIRKYKNGASANEILGTDLAKFVTKQRETQVFLNLDGIKFLPHEGGCGGTRQDSETLCRLLAGYIVHPNVAGATVLSLGCQNAQIPILQKAIERLSPNFSKPVFYFEQQQSKSEQEFIATAVKKTFVGCMSANEVERKPSPLSALVLGLECGGSDGFSGISANPALGHASDLLVALGGRAILSEFPELNGVEQQLIDRCVDERTAQKFAKLMKTYALRAEEAGSGFSYNPSPGNIRDGLITDAMKSAGAAKKGGTSPVVQVLDYTEQATEAGLSLLCTPGNDVESTTGLAGSGANLIVFTTGLGTPTGNPISPVMKLASNTLLAQRMGDIIDLEAGAVISGKRSIEEVGEMLLEKIIKVASGEGLTKAEKLGQDDFIPWKRGVSL